MLKEGLRGSASVMPPHMRTDLKGHLRVAKLPNKQFSVHSFRVGGAFGPDLAGTAVDGIMRLLNGRRKK